MFKMYAEYEDGTGLYFTKKSEDDCMCSINDETEHGACTFYTGVTDGEHYIDGEYYDYYDEEKDCYMTGNQ